MALELKQQVEALEASLTLLPEKDHFFCNSLINQFKAGKVLSSKQAYWVGKMLDAANAPKEPPPAPEESEGSIALNKLVGLFDKAGAKLKSPEMLLKLGEQEFHLTVAKPHHKVPGSINVMSFGNWETRQWYGRVHKDGTFEANRKIEVSTLTAVAQALRALGSDPAKVAAEYGKLTGRCCCCGLPLSDPRSTAVGYGRTCAHNWSLPYPKMSEVSGFKHLTTPTPEVDEIAPVFTGHRSMASLAKAQLEGCI